MPEETDVYESTPEHTDFLSNAPLMLGLAWAREGFLASCFDPHGLASISAQANISTSAHILAMLSAPGSEQYSAEWRLRQAPVSSLLAGTPQRQGLMTLKRLAPYVHSDSLICGQPLLLLPMSITLMNRSFKRYTKEMWTVNRTFLEHGIIESPKPKNDSKVSFWGLPDSDLKVTQQ